LGNIILHVRPRALPWAVFCRPVGAWILPSTLDPGRCPGLSSAAPLGLVVEELNCRPPLGLVVEELNCRPPLGLVVGELNLLTILSITRPFTGV
jgi:hypothetical protein